MRVRIAVVIAGLFAVVGLCAGCTKAVAGTGSEHFSSGQAIANALAAGGFAVTQLHPIADNFITETGGKSWDFAVDEHGRSAGSDGDSGINFFPNAADLADWVKTSKQFNGIAVTGDVWAISLPSTDHRAASLRLAPEIAKVLGGTVQK